MRSFWSPDLASICLAPATWACIGGLAGWCPWSPYLTGTKCKVCCLWSASWHALDCRAVC